MLEQKDLKRRLIQAGWRNSSAPVTFTFVRLLMPIGLALLAGAQAPVSSPTAPLSDLPPIDYALGPDSQPRPGLPHVAIAVVMLVISFTILLGINLLQWRVARHQRTA